MKPELQKNKDFWAGVMFIGIGTAGILIARNYRLGSALRMGPGFFPMILSAILIAFGICIMAAGLHTGEKIKGRLSFRAAFLLPLSLVLFGVLIKEAGFIPGLLVLVFVSAVSGREFKLAEVLLLALVLTVASVALFIWGLGLPYPLIKGL